MQNKLNIKAFRQTRDTTCGVVCMMMVLNHFFDTPLTRTFEGRLRKKLKLNRFNIVPVISLVMHLKEYGLAVKIRHDYPERFWEFMESFPEDFVEQMKKKFAVASKRGIAVIRGELPGQELLHELEQGNLVILGTELSSQIKHAILLVGVAGDQVTYIDPLGCLSVASIDEIMRRASMDVGRWYISISK